MTPQPAPEPAAPDPDAPGLRVVNTVAGGVQHGPILQGRDLTVQLPPHIAPALGGLRAPSPAFTARTADLDTLLRALAPTGAGPRAVLVTAVAGLAGVGKTELAVKAATLAWKERGWFPGGVLFTDLHGYDPARRLSPEQALDGLLRALAVPGEHLPHTLQDRQRLYRSVLAAYAAEGRRILVVVDNAATADQVRPLLPGDGVNAALVTSRHNLAVDARLHHLGVLDEPGGVALLDSALRLARGEEDTRFADDPAAAARIARLCGGLPLALSIAAALLADDHTRQRTAAHLAEALAAEHTRLRRLSREDHAVRAAFDLSYGRLGAEHARLFRLLPLNPGPDLSTEAAAHLADVDLLDAEELLEDLARAHLVERGTAWTRWRLHDLVRLYADSLDGTDTDARGSARTRLSTHYVGTAVAAATHLNAGPHPRSPAFRSREDALDWLDTEYANLLATGTTAHRRGEPAPAVHLASTLATYFEHRRHFHDLITVSTMALPFFREHGDRHSESQALNNLGAALREVRRFDEAIAAHTESLAVCRERGDRRGEGTALNSLGLALKQLRRPDDAVDAHTRATDIYRETEDRHGEAQALNNLGLALRQVGRTEDAIDAHTQAADICRETGDRGGEGAALNNLGIALRQVHRHDDAIDAYTRATDICRETGDRHSEGLALGNLGIAFAEVGRLDDAVDAHTRAAEIYREAGDRHSEGTVSYNLGKSLAEAGRLDEAVDAHSRAADIYRETGDRHSEAAALNNLGVTHARTGRREDGLAALERALEIDRALAESGWAGIEPDLARALQTLAWLSVDIDTETVLPGAQAAAEEAVELLDRLAAEQPEHFAAPRDSAQNLLEGILSMHEPACEAET